MENTVLYLDYYLTLREEKFSHEAAKQSALRFMEDHIPAGAQNDFQRDIWIINVRRVIDKVNRLMQMREEEE